MECRNLGLGVKGVLMFDDSAGEVGVVMSKGFGLRVALGEFRGCLAVRDELGEVDSGFAGREAPVFRILVICFLEGNLFIKN